jgi:hypothetical protein
MWENPDTTLIQANKHDLKLFDVYRADLNTGKADCAHEQWCRRRVG